MPASQIEIPPRCEPVTLNIAKSHLRVTISDDDELIMLYAAAAREGVEEFLARSLVNKGYCESFDSFPYYTDSTFSQLAYPPSYYSLPRYSTTLWNYSQMIKCFYSPLVSVERISYLSSADSQRHDLVPAPFCWVPNTKYAIGDEREDINGNLQQVTAASGDQKSGSTAPSWGTSPGDEAADRALVWTCQGPAPPGDFIYDGENEPPRIFPLPGSFWPAVLYAPNAVQIHYTAGYGNDGANIPALAKVGILQTLGSYYEYRESVSPVALKQVPGHVKDMLWSLRVIDFAVTRG